MKLSGILQRYANQLTWIQHSARLQVLIDPILYACIILTPSILYVMHHTSSDGQVTWPKQKRITSKFLIFCYWILCLMDHITFWSTILLQIPWMWRYCTALLRKSLEHCASHCSAQRFCILFNPSADWFLKLYPESIRKSLDTTLRMWCKIYFCGSHVKYCLLILAAQT